MFSETEKIKSLIAAAVVVIVVGMVWSGTGIYYETNDDRIITEILSGGLYGVPDAHTVYVNYLLSLPLMMLYQINPAIPWYGIFIVGTYTAASYLTVRGLLCLADSKVQVAVVSVISMVLLVSYIYGIGCIQYTSVAAMMAAAGYICLLTGEDKLRNRFAFFAAELLAFLLRQDAMLMIQPLGAAVYVGIHWEPFFRGKGKSRQYVGKWMVSLALVFVLGQIGTYWGYSEEEWRMYKEYNAARTEIFDYYGQPEYEEVAHILEKYAVDRAEYEAFSNYIILDEAINLECIRELADYAKMKGSRKIQVAEIAEGIVRQLFSKDLFLGGIRVVILWGITVGGCLLTGKLRLLLPLLYLAIGRTSVWAYLIYRGRLPYRVTCPLFYCEMLLLIVMCGIIFSKWQLSAWKRNGVCFAGAVFMVLSLVAGWKQYSYCRNVNQAQNVLTEGFREVTEYCRNHQGNQYILENRTFSYCRGSVFETGIYGQVNHIHSGGWYSNNPMMQQRINSYMGEWEEPVYLIVYDSTGDTEAYIWQTAQRYLEKKLSATPTLEDVIEVPSGASYQVWSFQ